MSNPKNALLSQLLPYDTGTKKNGRLKTGLKEYQSLLIASLEANNALQKGELEKFDSLVGENACEIRAVWMASSFSKSTANIITLIDQITAALTKIDALLSPASISSLMSSEASLETILAKEALDIPLTHEEMFMIQSYLLCEVKISKENPSSLFIFEVSDPKKLTRFGDVSTSFATNLLSRTRRSLATSSVQFVRDIAATSQDQTLIKMVSEKYTVEQNTLPCTPMFWTYKTVFHAAQEKGIPLVIHVKFLQNNSDGYTVVNEECLFFKCTPDGSYFHTEPTSIELNQPAWVIQGVATANKHGHLLSKKEWIAEITKQPITDVILAGAADHRQYPDPALDALLDGEKGSEYESYKALAEKEGFSSENPTTFFIQHVYAARVGKILDEVSLKASKPTALKEEHHFLSHFLPYDLSMKVGPRLLDGLKEYLLLLIASEQAIQSLQRGELSTFDPIVGENACQIRALKLALIISKHSFDTERLLNDIKNAKIKIEELLSRNSNLLQQKTSLLDVLETEQLDVELHYNEFYLIKSYLLSKVKVAKPFKTEHPLIKNEGTDSKKIKEISSVGSKFAEDLVTDLREKLSESSVTFVQEIAKQLPSIDPSLNMLSDKFIVKHRKLHCLPCFWATKTLMQGALHNHIPIVMIVEQRAKDRDYGEVQKTAIFFQSTTDGYVEAPYSSLKTDMPALVLLGTTCRDFHELPNREQWIQELLEYSPIDLILAYAAAHRQYPDQSKDELLLEIQDIDYEYYKMKAQEWGCSSENPSRFFLSHAFCDRIGNFAMHM